MSGMGKGNPAENVSLQDVRMQGQLTKALLTGVIDLINMRRMTVQGGPLADMDGICRPICRCSSSTVWLRPLPAGLAGE